VSYKTKETSAPFTRDLFAALKKRGIYAFRDTKIDSGKVIWTELEKAIETSMIAVIVFSENYAASEWCLNELEKIMECNRNSQQTVLPIFFVDPSEVRNLNGNFGRVFAQGKEAFGEDKVQSWKAALNEAANLAGFYMEVTNWYQIYSHLVFLISIHMIYNYRSLAINFAKLLLCHIINIFSYHFFILLIYIMQFSLCSTLCFRCHLNSTF